MEGTMVKDKLYLGSVEFTENEYNVKVYATLDDPDFKGYAIGGSYPCSLRINWTGLLVADKAL
jgi:hypothetical protein